MCNKILRYKNGKCHYGKNKNKEAFIQQVTYSIFSSSPTKNIYSKENERSKHWKYSSAFPFNTFHVFHSSEFHSSKKGPGDSTTLSSLMKAQEDIQLILNSIKIIFIYFPTHFMRSCYQRRQNNLSACINQ